MNSIKEAFQKINTDSTEVLQGTVISTGPLEIQMEGDEKHIVSEEVTYVPEHLRDYEVQVTVPAGGGGTASGKATVKNSLKKGESVYLLASNKGKQYFVLGRV